MGITATDPDSRWTTVEFVCPSCLYVRMGKDTDRPPHCGRCRVKMLAEDRHHRSVNRHAG